jgi:hypothetical protein
VVGWQWYRWIEGIGAIILVPVREWQWQYCGSGRWLNAGQYLRLGHFQFQSFHSHYSHFRSILVNFCQFQVNFRIKVIFDAFYVILNAF